MQRLRAIIFLSQAVWAFVIALRLNGTHPPAGDMFKSAALEPGERIVAFQGQTSNKKTYTGGTIHDDGRYIDNPYVIRSDDYVRIPRWFGRSGNNLHQLFHAIVYAESQYITLVKMPQAVSLNGRDGTGADTLGAFLDLPAEFNVQPRLSSKADCSFDNSYFHEVCALGYAKEDFRQALLTYVKPHIKQEVEKTCRSKAKASDAIVIHLRGGDLVDDTHPQSRMPPCSFYHHLIAINNFSSVKLVVEDGEHDHVCRKSILTAFNGSTVRVEETDHSLIDDICTLMTSQYVSFGLTTFAESLSMMNGQLKKVYVPALKYNGAFNGLFHDIEYGSENDMSGTVECGGNLDSCAKGFIEYALYDIPGFDKIRSGKTKMEYIHHEGLTYSQLKTCGHCVV